MVCPEHFEMVSLSQIWEQLLPRQAGTESVTEQSLLQLLPYSQRMLWPLNILQLLDC